MSKFHELFPDLQELFVNSIKDAGNLDSIRIKIVANNSLKEIKKVSKANEITNYLTDENVIIEVNEEIFEMLDLTQQQYVIDETLAEIYVDMETEKIKILKPDFKGFSFVILKYGIENSVNTNLAIKAAFAQKKEQDEENGQAAQTDTNE